jgi:hypothetical protein
MTKENKTGSVSRRDFLKLAGILAGGAAFTTLKRPNIAEAASGNANETGALCGIPTVELGIGLPSKAEMVPMANNTNMGVRARDKAVEWATSYFIANGKAAKEYSVQTLKVSGSGKNYDGSNSARSQVNIPLIRATMNDGSVRRVMLMTVKDGSVLDIPTKDDLVGGSVKYMVLPVNRLQEKVAGNQPPAPINFVVESGNKNTRAIGSGYGEWIVDLGFMQLPEGVNRFIPISNSNNNPFLVG